MSFRSGQRSFLNLLFQVTLIAVGVFLALWANNWHEDREHRAQAKAALRNFASEMEANPRPRNVTAPITKRSRVSCANFSRAKSRRAKIALIRASTSKACAR